MASRTLQALFLAAHRNAEWSRRVSWLGVLIAVVFYLGIWTPGLETARDRDQALFESKALRQVAASLDRLEETLATSSTQAIAEIRRSNAELPDVLSADLERLQATVDLIRSENEASDVSEGETPEEDNESGETDTTIAESGSSPFELVDDRTIAAIRDARARDELMLILEPVVDQLIVRPRFSALRNRWQTKTLPALAAGLDSVASGIPPLRSSVSDHETEWERLIASIATFRRRAGELDIGPPRETGWWALPDTTSVEPGLDAGTAERLKSPPAIAILSEDAQLARDRLRAVSQAVAGQRAELLASPLGSENLPIHALAPYLPALLGCYLGLLAAGRSRALRELVTSTHLHVDKGAPAVLDDWCLQQLRWDLAITPATGNGRFAIIQVLTAFLFAVGWIAAAASQLVSLSALDQEHIFISAGAGLVAILLATIHRVSIISASRRLLTQPDQPALEAESPLGNDLIDAPLTERE